MKKIQVHLFKAKRNKAKAEKMKEKGQDIKANHYNRISEAHYRNAMHYLKHSDEISLAMAI